MNTEQVILNLDNIKPTKNFIEFNEKQFEIINLTLEEASEVLLEMTNVKDENKLHLFVLEKCIPSIIPVLYKMNDNQIKGLIAKILQVCFRVDLNTAINMLNTDEDTVKKKIKIDYKYNIFKIMKKYPCGYTYDNILKMDYLLYLDHLKYLEIIEAEDNLEKMMIIDNNLKLQSNNVDVRNKFKNLYTHYENLVNKVRSVKTEIQTNPKKLDKLFGRFKTPKKRGEIK